MEAAEKYVSGPGENRDDKLGVKNTIE